MLAYVVFVWRSAVVKGFPRLDVSRQGLRTEEAEAVRSLLICAEMKEPLSKQIGSHAHVRIRLACRTGEVSGIRLTPTGLIGTDRVAASLVSIHVTALMSEPAV